MARRMVCRSFRGRASVSLLLAVLLLDACRAPDQTVELPFETIEQIEVNSTSYELWPLAPDLMVAANAQEADALASLVTPSALASLRATDYQTEFVLMAFLGRQPTSHEGIRIDSVVRRGESVLVSAWVGRRTGHDTLTFPYHLIRVHKTGQWGGSYTFELSLNGTVAVSRTRSLP